MILCTHSDGSEHESHQRNAIMAFLCSGFGLEWFCSWDVPIRVDLYHSVPAFRRYLLLIGLIECHLLARLSTSPATLAIHSISASLRVGCTTNIRLVWPSSWAIGNRESGRISGGNALSK